ncbi:hypothetical protein GUJ93_ZPchr0061g33653, partial [Zizania palustris]
VCRRHAYGGGSQAQQPPEQKVETTAAARSADDVRALLLGVMLNQRAGGSPCTLQMEQQKLLRQIDSFLQQSTRREQR